MIGDEELLDEALMIKERNKNKTLKNRKFDPLEMSPTLKNKNRVIKAPPEKVLKLKKQNSIDNALASASSSKSLIDSATKTNFKGALSFGKKNKQKDEQIALSNQLYDHLCYEVANRVQYNKEQHQKNVKKMFKTIDGNEMKKALG